MAIQLTREELASLSRLWDEAQRLPAAHRAQWLESLDGSNSSLKSALELMLREPGGDPDDFLEVLPSLAGSPAAGPARERRSDGPRAGPYRLIRPLGSGGMGAVWLAEGPDASIKRPVALKLLHPWLIAPRFLEQFARERDIVASLNHQFIARMFDAGFTREGQPYLALEYVNGSPLLAHCDARRLGVLPRLELFQQILEAVRYAHANRVVHRDLKPSNIVMSADGHAHLLDFGIAALLTDAKEEEMPQSPGSRANELTPSYAAPEQIGGRLTTNVSDVYSLGVTLYELLCGRRPYRLAAGTPAEMEQAALDVDIPLPSTACTEEQARCCNTTQERLAATLSGDLDAIICTALRRRPGEHYPSVDALAADIERFMEASSPLPRPGTLRARAMKLLP